MPTLESLVELCRNIEMTEDQKREQRKSFVYGNCSIENENVTREIVEEADRSPVWKQPDEHK